MKIEAGKCYRTRNGRKATIYRTDALGEEPIHGCVCEDGEEVAVSWFSTGHLWKTDSEFDLVSPWVDEPTMDISALPAWATHVNKRNGYWSWDTAGVPACEVGFIPDQYAPTQTVPVGSRYRIDREANRLVLEEGGAE